MFIYIFCFWSNPIFLNVDQLDCDPSPYCECSLSYLISIDGLQLALLPWQRIPKSTRWYELKWLQSQHDQSRLVEITDKAASPRVFPVQNWLSCWPLCLCFLHRDCWILFDSLWLFHKTLCAQNASIVVSVYDFCSYFVNLHSIVDSLDTPANKCILF